VIDRDHHRAIGCGMEEVFEIRFVRHCRLGG
jgi:hypothetical protein